MTGTAVPPNAPHGPALRGSFRPGGVAVANASASRRLFCEWQDAVAALGANLDLDEAHPLVLRLSAEVVRTANAVIADRASAGWNAPDDVVLRQYPRRPAPPRPENRAGRTPASQSAGAASLGHFALTVK